MAFAVNMPRLGLNEEENMLGEWYVHEGDVVAEGDKLFSLETDKSTMDVFAEQAGTILKCLYAEWDVVPVMTPVCVIGEPGENFSTLIAGFASATSVDQNSGESIPTAELVEEIAQTPLKVDSIVETQVLYDIGTSLSSASPRARKLAEANGIDLKEIQPTGAEGRIIEIDVLHMMERIPTSAAVATEQPTISIEAESPKVTPTAGGITSKTSSIRRLIANNIMTSLHSTAQTTQHMRFNASKLQSYRAWLKMAPSPEKDISLHDMISYITVKTLMNFDYMNAHMYSTEEITTFNFVNLGCAVSTEKGLLVPTIKNAQDMSLANFASAMKSSINKTRDGKISPAEMADATFTVSNLGNYGITTFTPILNPPQVGILGIGTIDYAVRNTPEGLLYYPAGYLSLTYDHRAMDGVPAVEFLRALCRNLESMEMISGE